MPGFSFTLATVDRHHVVLANLAYTTVYRDHHAFDVLIRRTGHVGVRRRSSVTGDATAHFLAGLVQVNGQDVTVLSRNGTAGNAAGFRPRNSPVSGSRTRRAEHTRGRRVSPRRILSLHQYDAAVFTFQHVGRAVQFFRRQMGTVRKLAMASSGMAGIGVSMASERTQVTASPHRWWLPW